MIFQNQKLNSLQNILRSDTINLTTHTKNGIKNKKEVSKITVDSFIDELVESEETVTPKVNELLSNESLNLEIYCQLY